MSDPSGCVFNLAVWDAEFQLSNVLSTVHEAFEIEASYNAIVNVTLPNFREAFTFSKTNGTDGSLNTVYKIDPAYDRNLFAPFARGNVMDVTNLGSYGSVVAQTSANFGSLVPAITGPTKPVLLDGTMQTALNSAQHVVRDYSTATNNRIASDYIGFLGYNCFGNASACNLFSDSSVTAYAAQLPGYDASFIATVDSMLDATASDTDQYDPSTNELYIRSLHLNNSLCYLLYNQILAIAPGRFDPSSNMYALEHVPDTQDDWYIPVLAGDVMQCVITMKSHVDQSLFGQPTPDGANAVAIEDRKYLIRFVVGEVAPKDGNSVDTTLVHDSPAATL